MEWFDEQLGTVEISLQSSFAATEFFGTLVKAKGVLELIVEFNWRCTRKDIELLRDAMKKSSGVILHVDLQYFQPSSLRTQLPSVSARYEPLRMVLEPNNLHSLHLALPLDLIRPSNFITRRPPHLTRLTLELKVGVNKGFDFYKRVRVLSEIPNINSATISWYPSTGKKGEQALFDAFKASTLATLEISQYLIREKEAQVLFEALKINSTLTTLNLRNNSI